MRWRGLLTGLLAAGLLAGCGSGEDPGGVAGVQTVVDSPKRADAFATPEELRWLGRLAAWSEGFSRDGTRVYAFENGEGFDDALAGDDEAISEYRQLLEPIRDCPDSFADDVGPAPTERLRHSELNFAEACDHFRRGVDLLVRALDEDDAGLAQRARFQIEDAGRKASIAAGALPPGEKQDLPVRRGPSSASRIEPGYGRASSLAAEKVVEARCWSAADWRRLMVEEKVFSGGRVNEQVLGFASAGGKRINLGPMVCRELDRLVYDGERPGDVRRHGLALALVVLVHESRHAAGIADEPTAECEAIQLVDEAAEELEIERGYARSLVDVYWESYPALPAGYRSAECRDGGELDLSPGDGRFP